MNKNSESHLTEKEFSQVFVQEYLYENKNIQKRFSEQVASGNIIKEKDGYRITQRGMVIMKFYSFIADIFRINKVNIVI